MCLKAEPRCCLGPGGGDSAGDPNRFLRKHPRRSPALNLGWRTPSPGFYGDVMSKRNARGRTRREDFLQLLGLFPAGLLIDLGTGHGGFARAAADVGWQVTAVDARTERWPDDDRVTWVKGDIRNQEFDRFDVVACLGVFYHLTCEDQVSLLARCAGRPMIIDTHLDHGQHEHTLSDRVTQGDGYEGRFYREPKALTSAWENPRSFWPTLEAFHRMFAESGFCTVLTVEPWTTGDRTFFLALPTPTS